MQHTKDAVCASSYHRCKLLTDQFCLAAAFESVQSVMLTCKRLVPAATRALYFSPQVSTSVHPDRAALERSRYRAWLFRQSLLDKPELAAMIRNLTNLPKLLVALPTTREISSTASAIAESVARKEYQRQVLQLATAATSVGVLLTDPEDASKVGTILATRRLSHVRIAYLSSMIAPIPAFAAFLKGLHSDGAGGAPEFSALEICMSVDEESSRVMSFINQARDLNREVTDLNYEVTDLGFRIERHDINEAALFLPSDVTKLARLRYEILLKLRSFEFVATTLEQRVQHNVITEFAINNSGQEWDEDMGRDQYSDPDEHDFSTIQYPLALFRLFPSLEQLVLSHGVNMMIEKLELLATSSPSLKVLRLPFTLWDVDAADLVEIEHGGLCLFETQLLATLDRLVCLERVELGVLPFSANRPVTAF